MDKYGLLYREALVLHLKRCNVCNVHFRHQKTCVRGRKLLIFVVVNCDLYARAVRTRQGQRHMLKKIDMNGEIRAF